MKNTKKNIMITNLHPFEGHPYKVQDNEEMNALIESIQGQGVLSPIIVRPKENTENKYEIISGHRRVRAATKAGMTEIPAIILPLDRDAAAIAVADSNLHREHILPSEKAFAYKLKMEALSHQGKAINTPSRQVVGKLETADLISETESGRQVQRYIRLTHLIPELLKLVDEERIAFTPAVELSYLPDNEQRMLAEEIEYTDATPSLSQAQRLRKYSEQGILSIDTIFAVLSEEKPNQKEQVKFKTEDIRKYFPKSYTSLDMQKTIISLLEKWQRQRERNRGEAR